MNEKIKAWASKHKVELWCIGMGVLTGLGSMAIIKEFRKAPETTTSPGGFFSPVDTWVHGKPMTDYFQHAEPYIYLNPANWSSGTLARAIGWTEDDALVLVENITADKLGNFGEDLLDTVMKEGEPVDIIVHVLYKK